MQRNWACKVSQMESPLSRPADRRRSVTEVNQISTITLNSNMSGESLELQVGSYRDGLVDCAVKLYARIWDGDHEQSASLSVENIVLSAARLCELRNRIETWLASKQVGAVSFSGEYPLAADGYSRLNLIFGTREYIIASSDKPVVTIGFNIGRINGEFYFVTDQSCLTLFAGDVARVIPDD